MSRLRRDDQGRGDQVPLLQSDLVAFTAAREMEVEKPLFAGHPAVVYSVWQWPVIVLTLGIAYVVYWLKSLAIGYEITTQRVPNRTRHSVEDQGQHRGFFRIDHFDLHKPLGMRLAGFCLLHLRSSDASFETVVIYGIRDLEALADTLRECSLRERTRRRVTTFVQA